MSAIYSQLTPSTVRFKADTDTEQLYWPRTSYGDTLAIRTYKAFKKKANISDLNYEHLSSTDIISGTLLCINITYMYHQEYWLHLRLL